MNTKIKPHNKKVDSQTLQGELKPRDAMKAKIELDFNIALGRRLEHLRLRQKMSLDYLGKCIGVRGQQIHKYETGENRISPERLAAYARIFSVPVGYFYGEEDKNDTKYFDKNMSGITTEINALPYNIRQSIYNLSRTINKSFSEFENLINDKEKIEQP